MLCFYYIFFEKKEVPLEEFFTIRRFKVFLPPLVVNVKFKDDIKTDIKG